MQGGAFTTTKTGPGSETCPAIGEKALAFSTPWTATGLRSQFTYENAVSPCTPGPIGTVHYQTGSAFTSSTDGKVKLLIDESENGSNSLKANFKRILLGSSTDGKNFTWVPFVRQSVVGGRTYSVAQATLVQATANTNWWGVFLWAFCTRCDGTDNVPSEAIGFWAQGRMRVIMDPSNVRGFVVYLMMQDGVTWGRVNDDGTFNFVPFATSAPSARSIVGNNGTWEAWGGIGGLMPNGGCDDHNMSTSSAFGYFTVSQGGPTFGPLQTVTSISRAMPSQNAYGRIDPFRMQDMNGKRLVYSVTTDRICEADQLDGFHAAEIVVTEVNN